MIAWYEQALTLEPDRAHLQLPGRRRAAHEAHVDRRVAYAGQDLGCRPDLGGEHDLGEAFHDRRKEPRRGVVARADAVRDDQRPLLAGPEAADVAPQLLAGVQKRRASLEQERAGGGQLELVRRPVQQLDAELLLEQPHLTAERGLGDMEPLGRAREVAFLRDRDEVVQPS